MIQPLNDTQPLPTGDFVALFGASWCRPCAMTKQSLQTVMETKPLAAYYVDGEESPGLMGQFFVRTFPTLIIFKDGQPVDTIYGGKSPLQLRDALGRFL